MTQLRREEGIERMEVSKAAAEFMAYIEEKEDDDKLLTKYLAKQAGGGGGPARVLGRLCSGGIEK